MKNLKSLLTMLSVVFALACFHVFVSGQSGDSKTTLGVISATGLTIGWKVTAPHDGVTMTIAAPDGRVFRRHFKPGTAPEFKLVDKQGERLPDGEYNYELRLAPVLSPEQKEKLARARARDHDPEEERAARKPEKLDQPLVESGTFSIHKGAIIISGGVEPKAPRNLRVKPVSSLSVSDPTSAAITKLRQHHHFSSVILSLTTVPDNVIADDLIVQGSACVGLDCVNGEVFGFTTLMLKENNLRILFKDTSVTPGYPRNDWQITANDSNSGGAAKFSIEDITGAHVPFTIEAGAPDNSLFVDSGGRLGIGTSVPVLDIDVASGNTPSIRLAQTGSAGWPAQAWDIGANDSNFFVRDVTGGSRLPFRIIPLAPSNSFVIAADGDVGIGTASPLATLHISSTTAGAFAPELRISNSNQNSDPALKIYHSNNAGWRIRTGHEANSLLTFDFTMDDTAFSTKAAFDSSGRMGIGTNAPDKLLSVNGDASKVGGGSWQSFSDERLKNIKGRFNSGLKAVMQLQPVRYEYRRDNVLGLPSSGEHVGFAAQAVQNVIPEAVTKSDSGYLMVNNDPILWTMLNAIKEQQKQIEQLKSEVRQLRATSRRRR